MAALMSTLMASVMPDVRDMLELEHDLLLEALYQRFGHDFRAHDRTRMAPRLQALMAQRGLATVSALQEKLLHEDGMAQHLVAALAPAPAGLFDDPAFTRDLRGVLALLHASPVPKIWLADCTSAPEAWALAIVLAEEKLDTRTEIFATCANDALVAAMRDATVPASALAAWHDGYVQGGGSGALADFFEIAGGHARLRSSLRARITWAQYSLVTDASFNEFQAILCSRAVPDFGPALRQRALTVFHDSLARFGVLAVDRQLAPGDLHVASYQAIGTERHWYKRVA